MTTAWDFPRNPLTDSSVSKLPNAALIRHGFRIFMETNLEASHISPNKLSCNNCHLNGGQKERAMPLVGIANVYPEYNKRSGRIFSIEDRIIGCFTRSQNGTATLTAADSSLPSATSKEVVAIAAYLSWLSAGTGKELPWRGKNSIAANKLIPVRDLNPQTGQVLFVQKCSSCHGEDGQGVAIGDKKAGPLWGADSWNDGAGAARVYTLAGMIRYAMPYLEPGSLTDEEAQHIAAYICSMPRPVFPFKAGDYTKEKLPPDALYYKTLAR